MAKKRAARATARRVKDKWKSKQWYTIRAPSIFNEAQIGETMADEPEKLSGRIAEATLQDVTGDFSKMHVKCYFRVRGTRGTDAVTTFDGHDLTSDYVRRLVRRSHSKVDDTFDLTTADGFQIRLKPMIVTERRCQSSQQEAIRQRARDVMASKAELQFNEVVRQVLQGDVAKEIYDSCRLIMPLKRVEVRKSELIGEPGDAVEILDVFAPPAEPETPDDAAEDDDGDDGDEGDEPVAEDAGASDEGDDEASEDDEDDAEGADDGGDASDDAASPDDDVDVGDDGDDDAGDDEDSDVDDLVAEVSKVLEE